MKHTSPPLILWVGVVVFGYLWFVLLKQLSLEWSANAQYSYGWSVPVLCGLLARKRWTTRPALCSPLRPSWAVIVAAFLALIILPTRVVQEAMPDWRPLTWLLGASVLGTTLCA